MADIIASPAGVGSAAATPHPRIVSPVETTSSPLTSIKFELCG